MNDVSVPRPALASILWRSSDGRVVITKADGDPPLYPVIIDGWMQFRGCSFSMARHYAYMAERDLR